ncbi:hypothetical protein HELRODRAFT_182035 [Helobdella robusta]|uniref:Uncharacterized protein n=1 Tax=Helobdella robusta TaxID=6412 RepID=T1FHM4_HELRO|nr:hypothetical protein HELRODRAFT_182035 [Helobdella robusta]ESN91858.1 hypothetical protein HELRODRAFT_182035 [Helobdella robusta]
MQNLYFNFRVDPVFEPVACAFGESYDSTQVIFNGYTPGLNVMVCQVVKCQPTDGSQVLSFGTRQRSEWQEDISKNRLRFYRKGSYHLVCQTSKKKKNESVIDGRLFVTGEDTKDCPNKINLEGFTSKALLIIPPLCLTLIIIFLAGTYIRDRKKLLVEIQNFAPPSKYGEIGVAAKISNKPSNVTDRPAVSSSGQIPKTSSSALPPFRMPEPQQPGCPPKPMHPGMPPQKPRLPLPDMQDRPPRPSPPDTKGAPQKPMPTNMPRPPGMLDGPSKPMPSGVQEAPLKAAPQEMPGPNPAVNASKRKSTNVANSPNMMKMNELHPPSSADANKEEASAEKGRAGSNLGNERNGNEKPPRDSYYGYDYNPLHWTYNLFHYITSKIF